MPAAKTIIGSTVDSMPTARPPMMLVAWPVPDFCTMEFTGRLPIAGVVFRDDGHQRPHDQTRNDGVEHAVGRKLKAPQVERFGQNALLPKSRRR